MRWANLTDVGLERDANEDNLLSTTFTIGSAHRRISCDLHVVSDGMGGAVGGEVASRLSIQAISQHVFGALVEAHATPGRVFVNPGHILVGALQSANTTVHSRSRENPRLMGMGATVTALLACQGKVFIGHVGDSRAYLWRQGVLRQITLDHSLVAELLRDGRITAEQARNHPRKNIITRAIGSRPQVSVDLFILTVGPGDTFLLCSDGLSGMVPDPSITEALGRDQGQADGLLTVCDDLICRANEGGGLDNISVVLAQVEPSDLPAEPLDFVSLERDATLSWHEASILDLDDASFLSAEP